MVIKDTKKYLCFFYMIYSIIERSIGSEERRQETREKPINNRRSTFNRVIGVTYAWLTQTIDKTKTNVIKAGTLELTYKNESEGIYLSGEKAQPVSDEEGKKYTPYKFTLKNTGDFKADYTIYLDDTTTYKDGEEEITIEKDKFMKNAFIKYRLLSSNTYTTDTKPDGTSNIETLQLLSNLEESPNRVLEEGNLASGESKDYELTLWISSEADNSVVGTVFAGKIRVEATQSEGKVKPVSFSADSWEVIAKAIKKGNYPYQVGDTKEIDMGELGKHTVRVANTSPCTNGETSETACGFVVEFADIISNHRVNVSSNKGGWPTSEVRTYVNVTVYNALPSDLKSIITETKVISGHGSTSGETNFTSSDKLYLLSSKEVYGKKGTSNIIIYDTAEAETRQLDYYELLGVTTSNHSSIVKQYGGSNGGWWLRTANSNTTTHFFTVASYDGDWNRPAVTDEYGVSPAFRIA